MLLNERQDTVGADRRQSGRSHHQPREHAALHIERILRHLVDVGTVDDIGVGDQPVARGREQAGHWSGIARMSADIGIYAGRHDQDGREALAALVRSRTKIQYRARPRRVIVHQAGEDADLAIDVAFAGSRGGEAQRHGVGGKVFAEMGRDVRQEPIALGWQGNPYLLLIESH